MYQLLVNETEVRVVSLPVLKKIVTDKLLSQILQMYPCLCFQPCKFLVDTVFAKGMTVRQSKEELLPQLKEHCKLDLSIER